MRPLRRGRENVRNKTEEEFTMTAVEATGQREQPGTRNQTPWAQGPPLQSGKN